MEFFESGQVEERPPEITPEPTAEPTSVPATSLEPELIRIPAGRFRMGSDPRKDKQANGGEQPQHTLYPPTYYIAKTPVTNAQYAVFVQDTGHDPPRHWEDGRVPRGKHNHPVASVSWHDAVAYCRWLSKVTGKDYNLPSEAEWEKAARGTDGRIYPWGDRWDASRCNSAEGGKGDTTAVGAYPRGVSPYGVLDMAGNVWEWTRSLYRDYPYDPTDGREEPEAEGLRVLRGGAGTYPLRRVRCAYRFRNFPGNRGGFGRFRVVVSPITEGLRDAQIEAIHKTPTEVRLHRIPVG